MGIILQSPALAQTAPQKTDTRAIPRVAKIPSLPAPYQMRDWRKTTHDYLDIAFDFDRTGEFLPLIRWADKERSTFFLPSFVGGDGPEAINCLAAVVSGTLIGLDMTKYRGRNWVKMTQAYYNPQDGVYTNNLRGRAGGSFWYDLFPNILFYQIADRYPTVGDSPRQFARVAEQWRRAYETMGGKFDHTAFRLETMTPVDNGQWTEPDSAAGIAWLEYMAFVRLGDARYRAAADGCLRALEKRPPARNPLYEVLLPYGALTAARMNAELGTDYDVGKLVNWCFEAGDNRAARPGWGVITDKFGTIDCAGLVGSVTDTDGYAFAMNTFEWAGAMTPLVRYDTRYADAIGKWMHNLANASRYYYPDSLPAAQQDNRPWSDTHDPQRGLCYEGLRKKAWRVTRDGEPFRTEAGVFRKEGREQTLTSAPVNGVEQINHLWRLTLPPGRRNGSHDLGIFARCEERSPTAKGVRFLWAAQPDGPYQELFTVLSGDRVKYYGSLLNGANGAGYLKALSVAESGAQTLHLESLWVNSVDPDLTPYATGDALRNGGPSNLCLYGASHVGILGGIVGRTNNERILRLDLLKTDYFHAKAYPSYLLYNPYPTPKTVTFPVGPGRKDVYDARSHRFLQRGITGTASLKLPAGSAAVIVLTPAGGKKTYKPRQLLIDGVIVDYRFP